MAVDLPKYNEFHWPTVVALRALGGSATIEELNSQVINDGGYTEEQQSVIHKDGPMTALEYRLAWARTYLKGMGLAVNSERGVWTLTPAGRTVTEEEIAPLRRDYLARMRKASDKTDEPDEALDAKDASEIDWREQLLDEVMKLHPSDFERLAQRLLREEGFINTQVITTGTFTNDAKAEATRDGAPPIDLIDGTRLCDLLKTHRLGRR